MAAAFRRTARSATQRLPREAGPPRTGRELAAAELVHLTRFETPLGTMALASTEKGVVACSLPRRRGETPEGPGVRPGPEASHPEASVRETLRRRMPHVRIVEGTGRNAPYVAAVRAYLAGRRKDLVDVPLDLRGTEFQKKVWTALRRVPAGRTITYGQLAVRAGHPKAVRACGTANGANPVPLFVPCHRTIASDGSLGGFGGGLALKARLLELERDPR